LISRIGPIRTTRSSPRGDRFERLGDVSNDREATVEIADCEYSVDAFRPRSDDDDPAARVIVRPNQDRQPARIDIRTGRKIDDESPIGRGGRAGRDAVEEIATHDVHLARNEDHGRILQIFEMIAHRAFRSGSRRSIVARLIRRVSPFHTKALQNGPFGRIARVGAPTTCLA